MYPPQRAELQLPPAQQPAAAANLTGNNKWKEFGNNERKELKITPLLYSDTTAAPDWYPGVLSETVASFTCFTLTSLLKVEPRL